MEKGKGEVKLHRVALKIHTRLKLTPLMRHNQDIKAISIMHTQLKILNIHITNSGLKKNNGSLYAGLSTF